MVMKRILLALCLLITAQRVVAQEVGFQNEASATRFSTAGTAAKLAVDSKGRLYVLNFKDGSTVMAVGGVSQMATTAGGSFTAVFPVPLRGSVNTALNFNTAVSVTSVICCAAGFTSAN